MFIARKRFEKIMRKHLLRFCKEKVKHRQRHWYDKYRYFLYYLWTKQCRFNHLENHNTKTCVVSPNRDPFNSLPKIVQVIRPNLLHLHLCQATKSQWRLNHSNQVQIFSIIVHIVIPVNSVEQEFRTGNKDLVKGRMVRMQRVRMVDQILSLDCVRTVLMTLMTMIQMIQLIRRIKN